ncbi:unnamed protein product [Caenorhabditis angaria]|uniref:Olfactomedin-like domain-containing protein n=1 Tax=Caenorhabditis angaria TaxID=860376 RepID=A0A9P1I4T1_9PELO|nr:unnamed protein product [Caenorhabditis angaria]
MWKIQVIGPWILLIVSFFAIIYQFLQIHELQNTRQKRQLTTYRDDEQESTVLLPIFAQISKKHIRKVCMEQFHQFSNLNSIPMSKKSPKIKKEEKTRNERKCSGVQPIFSQPQLIGERRNQEACAYLDGSFWYICEMSHGYTILSFKGTRQLNASNAQAVQFLPYPFEGTDNTVLNETMYYTSDDRLISYNFRDETTKTLKFKTSHEPLYINSTSSVDIQAEEHGLWIIYKRDDILTVSRMKNMEIVSNWTLPSIDPAKLCNLFIRCAVLYSVECNGNVTPVYDFWSHNYIRGKEIKWNGLGNTLSNVQYDPLSKSIAIFSDSKIFKVSVESIPTK